MRSVGKVDWKRCSNWHSVHMQLGYWLRVKNLPATQKVRQAQVQSLSWEDPLEKGMAIHSNVLAWRISWKEEPGRLQSIGLYRVGHN